jgi:hypothetical protein
MREPRRAATLFTAGVGHSLPLYLVLTVCSLLTGLPVHSRRILRPDLATRYLFKLYHQLLSWTRIRLSIEGAQLS